MCVLFSVEDAVFHHTNIGQFIGKYKRFFKKDRTKTQTSFFSKNYIDKVASKLNYKPPGDLNDF
jgi:hypothetical protein